MESLPTLNERPSVRVIPLPIALYEIERAFIRAVRRRSPYEPTVIRWKRLQPVFRKDDINTNEKEWSRKALQAAQMRMVDFLNAPRQCFIRNSPSKQGAAGS
jgi:hypothetical protein